MTRSAIQIVLLRMSVVQNFSASFFRTPLTQRHWSDISRFGYLMCRLGKSHQLLPPLILPDGVSLKQGKKGGWEPVFKVNIYYLVSVLFAPNYWPQL